MVNDGVATMCHVRISLETFWVKFDVVSDDFRHFDDTVIHYPDSAIA
jgi:hypothetical protein